MVILFVAETHSGVTRQMAENFFAVLEVPYLSKTASRRRSVEVADVIYEAAMESCREAAQEEIQLSHFHE